ncbi:MAG: hypothetical protein AB1813_08290 [Verrucomicrobiota bacterium]
MQRQFSHLEVCDACKGKFSLRKIHFAGHGFFCQFCLGEVFRNQISQTTLEALSNAFVLPQSVRSKSKH